MRLRPLQQLRRLTSFGPAMTAGRLTLLPWRAPYPFLIMIPQALCVPRVSRAPNAAAFKTATAMEAERPAPYRVTILPTVLEVSARLATSEELRGLVKLLRASAVIWGKTETKEDCERPSYEVPEEDLLTLRDIWRRLNSTASKPFPR